MKENLMEIDRAKEPYTYITISSLVKMGKQIERLQEQLNEANKLLKYCCANYESSRFGATITEDGEILPKGPVWNYLKKWKV